MEKHNPFGRPDNVDKEELVRNRKIAEREYLVGLTTMATYLADSLYMKEWSCNECGITNIPCAQGTCPSCNNPRPPAWRDPEQGEGNVLGAHRVKARKK